uniref:Toxin 22 isoform b n=1 Tax=Cupiennius salei TaxID=6928 RepID=A0A4Y5UGW0_CUPSA|nr:toxin 22 isoform b precursor [Cupiennius salei]
MKYFIVLAVLATLVLAIQGDYCSSTSECGEGMCCTGSSFNRHCQRLSENGTPCQRRNDQDYYTYGCPCQEGLICSVINYCQEA